VKSTYVAGLLAGLVLGFLTSPAEAQSTPSFATSSAADDAWSTPKSRSFQEQANYRHLGMGLTTSAFIVGGRWEVANGGIVEIDVVWRKGFSKHQRIEVGGIGRFAFTPDASLIGGGIPVRGVLRMHDRLDMTFELILSYTRIIYNESFFPESNGFTPSLRWGIGYYVHPHVSIGVNPVAFSVVTGERVDAFLTYEPGAFIRFSPL
jgi:hypothetical protein